MLLAPSELEVNPQIWVNALHQYKIRSVYLSYSAVELATRDFANNLSALKVRCVDSFLRHLGRYFPKLILSMRCDHYAILKTRPI